jgi:tetratricopeptide (TPR) repeat protein
MTTGFGPATGRSAARRMAVLVVGGWLVAAPSGAQTRPATPATPAAPAPASPRAEVYREFLDARRLEAEGNLDGALAALQRAVALAPKEAEVHAELAAFQARQNRGVEAADAAEKALALDPKNEEARRILALVYAAWSETPAAAPRGTTAESWRTKAIEQFQPIKDTPAIATDLNLRLTYGRLLLRADRHAEAITVLEKIAAEAPYAAEPFVLLAEAHNALDHEDEAIEALEHAAATAPRYLTVLADAYERQGRWGDAAAAYERALAQSKGSSRDLRFRWIGALLNQPDGEGAEKAKTALTEYLAGNPRDARGLYLLSQAHRQLGELVEAEAAARRLLALDTSSLSGLYALAVVLEDRHEYAKIVELLTPVATDLDARAKGRENDAALLMAQLGAAQLQIGQRQAAIDALQRAQRLAPESPGYAAMLAEAHLQARQFDRARAIARQARTDHPDDWRLLRLEARAVARGGDPAGAVKLAQDSIGSAPSEPQAILALADIYEDAGRAEQAVDLVAPLAAKVPDDEGLAFRLASLHESAGQYAEAETLFREMIGRDPLNAPALNYLGYMLADRGQKLPEALDFIERALKVDPENPSYLDSQAWVLFKMKRTAEAEAVLAKAAGALRSNSVIQAHHAEVLAAMGRRDESAAAWQRALDGDGEDIDRADIEKRLRALGRTPK